MLSIPGIYEDGHVRLIEPIPSKKKANVIVTILDELGKKSGQTKKIQMKPFIGSLTNVGETRADLTESFGDEWEVD